MAAFFQPRALLECRGGPKDGDRVQAIAHPPKEPEIFCVSTYPCLFGGEWGVDYSATPIKTHKYELVTPEDEAPYYNYLGCW